MARLDQETILDAIYDLPTEEQLKIARTILSWADTTEAETLARALRHLSAFNVWLRAMPPCSF